MSPYEKLRAGLYKRHTSWRFPGDEIGRENHIKEGERLVERLRDDLFVYHQVPNDSKSRLCWVLAYAYADDDSPCGRLESAAQYFGQMVELIR